MVGFRLAGHRVLIFRGKARFLGRMDAPNGNLSSLLSLAFRVARREGLGVADAEDVSSVTVLSYLEVATKVERPSAWVFFVARRKAWALRRRSVVRTKYEAEQLSFLADAQAAHSESIETLLDLEAALDALGPIERVAVLWRDLAEESLGAIADTTGLSVKTIKRRLEKGRASLQRSLGGRSVRGSLRLGSQHRNPSVGV